ncbi:MAG: Nif11-like leader peptide family natural product precursor [Gemmatimonadota bacterium]|nr:MAG: Nif11-like leader peptide family natural product precursor [Gemmatimonadota bacterium]
MSKEAIAAFFKQVAEDRNLQQALVEFAARHGFKFTARELGEVDLLTLSGSIPIAPDEPHDDSADAGFGMGEYPA